MAFLKTKGATDDFKAEVESYSDDYIRLFVPDVYQENIYDIDYNTLWEKGIRVLTYDIDDTISDTFVNKVTDYLPGLKVPVPKDAKKFFAILKEMGFKLVIITNAREELAERFWKELGFDYYINRAEKPKPDSWEKVREVFGVEKSAMAHIGNNMRKDIFGGNDFGIVTCLVRNVGSNPVRKVLKTKGHYIRKELTKRGMWHKHHVDSKNDQYYHLGEKQSNSPNFPNTPKES